jgi:hypothetical protein
VEEATLDVLLYQGADEGMRFVTTHSFQLRNAGGMRLVEYFLGPVESNGEKTLWVNESLLPNDGELSRLVFPSIDKDTHGNFSVNFPAFQPRFESIRLISNVKDVNFRYLERLDLDRLDPEKTADQQPKPKRLPAAVEIKIQWHETGFFQARELAIVVPTHADWEKKPGSQG